MNNDSKEMGFYSIHSEDDEEYINIGLVKIFIYLQSRAMFVDEAASLDRIYN